MKSWFLQSSQSNIPDFSCLSQEAPTASCFGKGLRQGMPETTKPNLVDPKEQWCLRLATGAVTNKVHWWWPSSFRASLKLSQLKTIWPLVLKLAAIPSGKRVSSHLRDWVLRLSFPLCPSIAIFTLGSTPPTGNHCKNTPFPHGLSRPPFHMPYVWTASNWTPRSTHPFSVRKRDLALGLLLGVDGGDFFNLCSNKVRTGIYFMSL